jgi:hypothetical protein
MIASDEFSKREIEVKIIGVDAALSVDLDGQIFFFN